MRSEGLDRRDVLRIALVGGGAAALIGGVASFSSKVGAQTKPSDPESPVPPSPATPEFRPTEELLAEALLLEQRRMQLLQEFLFSQAVQKQLASYYDSVSKFLGRHSEFKDSLEASVEGTVISEADQTNYAEQKTSAEG